LLSSFQSFDCNSPPAFLIGALELAKMRLTTSMALCLVAALSNAIPTPQEDASAANLPTQASPDESQASDQLAQLAEFAGQTTNETLAENEKRDGCSLGNLSIRREW
jgi:tyrosinase